MYIDLTYIQARVKQEDLISYTRDIGEAEVINTTRIDALINDACAEFDNAASQGGYVVPIATPTEYIKRIVFDIFLYYLTARKQDDKEMKDVYVRYNSAYKKLKEIAGGQLKLAGISKTNSIYPVMTDKLITDRIFTETNLNY